MRYRRLPAMGLAALALALGALALGLGAVLAPGQPAVRAAAAARSPAVAGAAQSAVARGPDGARGAGDPCHAFPGARQLSGVAGVSPAAWSGGGLVVPACGPIPGASDRGSSVYPYPGALWTAGYQCVEFSERYLYDRYGVTMSILTNGDQVAAHYAAGFAGLFMVVRNGTPGRAPADGDVLSMSTSPGFNSADGGHTAVVQSASVDSAGNGTLTIVEENAAPTGVEVVPVTRWAVRYAGYPYVEWLTSTAPPAPAR